jgi:hypothetical protein
MGRQRVWRRFGLVVALLLVSLPASAGGRQERRERGLAGEVWAAVVRWVAPWGAKLGPGIDPDGVSGGSGGHGTEAARGGSGDLGPGIDPNG